MDYKKSRKERKKSELAEEKNYSKKVYSQKKKDSTATQNVLIVKYGIKWHVDPKNHFMFYPPSIFNEMAKMTILA